MSLRESDFAIPASQQDKRSAHTVVPNVCRKDDADGIQGTFFIKYNKHGSSTASVLEAGFSAIASSCLLPGLTPPMDLLYDDDANVTGLVSRNVREIVRRYGQNTRDVHFLSELPKGRFGSLLQSYVYDSDNAVDWDSLASVLCSAYFLEEDDLHRSNIGYFTKQQGGKNVLCFFKIDNDLCFSDSIMSRHAVRFWNLRHNSHSFDITRTDLLRFPDLRNYGTHYWPTRYSFLAKPCDPKIYDNFSDLAAFTALAHHDAFIKAKWRQFYRLTLIPEAIFTESLKRVLSTEDPEQKAYFDQILSATIAKQQALSAALFSMKPFRDWLQHAEFADDFFEADLGGIEPLQGNDIIVHGELGAMRQTVFRHRQLLSEFTKNDTPFHAAIRLGLYRFDQTWHDYGQYHKEKNDQGDTPAQLLLKKCLQDDNNRNCSNASRRALADMYARGAYQHCSGRVKAEIERLKPQAYFNRVEVSDNIALYEQIQRISRDTSLTLKMKKKFAIEIFRAYISHNPSSAALTELKSGLASDMRFAFIRLLQSRFWIFRYFRTLLLRGTTTFRQINSMLEDAIEHAQHHVAQP